jgi:2-hydroxy-3-keto-5-methylthiopentenyl-1-phosphate phosphatase
LVGRQPLLTCADLPHIVVDFDGTITERDIGNEICDRFAPPAWRDLIEAWRSGALSLPEAQKLIWAQCRASAADILAYTREVGAIRPGFDAFLEDCRARKWPLVLVSGGFDFYIEPLLGARLAAFEAAYVQHGVLEDGGVRVAFPDHGLGCDKLAVCKGKVCARHRGGDGVVFIGDGASDHCALGEADLILAVRGKRLAGWCAERADPWEAFEDFHEVLAALVRFGTRTNRCSAFGRKV